MHTRLYDDRGLTFRYNPPPHTLYQTHSYPSQAEIVITVDDVEANKYPFVIPNFSNVDS